MLNSYSGFSLTEEYWQKINPNAKTSHKMTAGLGKVVIKKLIYREKVRSSSLLK